MDLKTALHLKRLTTPLFNHPGETVRDVLDLTLCGSKGPMSSGILSL